MGIIGLKGLTLKIIFISKMLWHILFYYIHLCIYNIIICITTKLIYMIESACIELANERLANLFISSFFVIELFHPWYILEISMHLLRWSHRAFLNMGLHFMDMINLVQSWHILDIMKFLKSFATTIILFLSSHALLVIESAFSLRFWSYSMLLVLFANSIYLGFIFR